MNIQGAIFDMDGTLVDSMVYWKNLASEYLRHKGVAEVSAEVLDKIKPMTMTESAALFIQEFQLEGSSEQIADEILMMKDGRLIYRGKWEEEKGSLEEFYLNQFAGKYDQL